MTFAFLMDTYLRRNPPDIYQNYDDISLSVATIKDSLVSPSQYSPVILFAEVLLASLL